MLEGSMNNEVLVKGRSRDTAVLLLAAAEDLDLSPLVVRTTSKGYMVPPEVAEKAGMETEGEFDPSAHTVAEVEAYIEKHPDQRDAVLAAEESGKARKSLLNDEE